jgi:hypothetical protein
LHRLWLLKKYYNKYYTSIFSFMLLESVNCTG